MVISDPSSYHWQNAMTKLAGSSIGIGYISLTIPVKLRLIHEIHDTPTAGHPGCSKTLELLTRQYYCPKMHKDVDQYLWNSHNCQRSRTSCHAPFGILHPLPIPNASWSHLSMDFITGLPWTNGFNAILVVVCRHTKMSHLIRCRDTCTAEQLADLFARKQSRAPAQARTAVLHADPTKYKPGQMRQWIQEYNRDMGAQILGIRWLTQETRRAGKQASSLLTNMRGEIYLHR